MLTKEAVLQAVARGWCHENNANKEMDHDLAIAIAEEVIALRGMGGEAVGECVKATGSLKDMMIIRWRDGFTPHEGQLLYTAPAAPENLSTQREDSLWRAALSEAAEIIRRDVMLCAEDVAHDNAIPVKGGDHTNKIVEYCINAIERHIKESRGKSECSCGGHPHTAECAYQHFLSYSGRVDTPELRVAFHHGYGAPAALGGGE